MSNAFSTTFICPKVTRGICRPPATIGTRLVYVVFTHSYILESQEGKLKAVGCAITDRDVTD